jgi:hypothetical protein
MRGAGSRRISEGDREGRQALEEVEQFEHRRVAEEAWRGVSIQIRSA